MFAAIARLARISIFVVALFPLSAVAAGDRQDFQKAAEAFLARVETAQDQVRAGERQAAASEVSGMRAAWAAITTRFGKQPDDFGGDAQAYTTGMLEVSTRLVGVSMMIDTGRQQAAQDGLAGVHEAVSGLAELVGRSSR